MESIKVKLAGRATMFYDPYNRKKDGTWLEAKVLPGQVVEVNRTERVDAKIRNGGLIVTNEKVTSTTPKAKTATTKKSNETTSKTTSSK